MGRGSGWQRRAMKPFRSKNFAPKPITIANLAPARSPPPLSLRRDRTGQRIGFMARFRAG